MKFDKIEELKRKYTDKYVVVDETRPELKRFGGMTGTIKTVNMNGCALVEFDANNNIGWFDIQLDFLKVIDQPLPKPEAAEKAAKSGKAEKPKAEAAAKPAAKAPAKAAAAPKAAPAAKLSVAEMLEAARIRPGQSGAPSAPAAATGTSSGAAKVDPKKMSLQDILAAARGGTKPADSAATTSEKTVPPAPAAPAAAAAKLDPKKMSVADMLAAARGSAKGEAAPTPAAPPAAPLAAPPAKSPATASAKAEPKPAASAAPAATQKLDPKKMSVADMLAAARGSAAGTGAATAVPATPKSAPPAAPAPAAEAETEPAANEDSDVESAGGGAEAAADGPKKLSAAEKPNSTDEILAYCRRVDG
jgi:hypothetical protein